jgi:hypothetical protein
MAVSASFKLQRGRKQKETEKRIVLSLTDHETTVLSRLNGSERAPAGSTTPASGLSTDPWIALTMPSISFRAHATGSACNQLAKRPATWSACDITQQLLARVDHDLLELDDQPASVGIFAEFRGHHTEFRGHHTEFRGQSSGVPGTPYRSSGSGDTIPVPGTPYRSSSP